MEINDILKYWKFINIYQPTSLDIKSKYSKVNDFDNLSNVEIGCGNIRCSDLYKILNIEDNVENDTNETFVFTLKTLEDGRYLEDSFEPSRFLFYLINLNRKITIEEDFKNFKLNLNLFLKNKTRVTLDVLCEVSSIMIKELGLNEVIKLNSLVYLKNELSSNNPLLLQMDFYSKDLEWLLNENIKDNSYIGKIILGKSEEKLRIDNNSKFLQEITKIEKFPLAKWPGKFNPSLMQAVAINIATQKNYPKSFSVNGPPGTGKTTLLKEVIADNILKKALIIKDLTDEDFIKIKHNDAKVEFATCYQIPKELKELGIIIASNNNSAVENISLDLPKAEDLSRDKVLTEFFDLSYKDDIYFTKEINKLHNKENEFWGLISAPYGKSENIKKISSILPDQYNNRKNTILFELSEDKEILNKAKLEFNECLQRANDYQSMLKEKADNIIRFSNEVNGYNLFQLEKEILNLNKEINIKSEKNKLKKSLYENLVDEVRSKNLELAFRYNKLNFFKKLFIRIKIINYPQEILELNDCINFITKKLNDLNKKIKNLENEIILSKENKKKLQEIVLKIRNLEKLKENYNGDIGDSTYFKNILENENSQKNCPWLTKEYNEIREELFYKSLNLIYRFILSSNPIRQNLKRLEAIWNNKQTGYTKEVESKVFKECFSTLNLVIPVLSTTFASVQNRFSSFFEQDLGMVIIDEAGQATPFSAIGLLYRSSRCVIVGDPLQVEPVITTPKTLNCYFADKYKVKNNQEIDYTDYSLSIQALADSANEFYGKIKDKYVGCPLVIHRRCESPMFDISNKISYDNRMFNCCNVSKNKFIFDESVFINIKGKEIGSKNHYVPEQGAKIVEILEKELKRDLDLFKKRKNLFIITPFKSISKEINKHILRVFSNEENIKNWCVENIGTVHKFQGKEAKNVIFLLGCDSTSIKSAEWAAKQPNILNVAATRAKNRFIMVGDIDIWGKLENYKDAIKILEDS